MNEEDKKRKGTLKSAVPFLNNYDWLFQYDGKTALACGIVGRSARDGLIVS